MNSQLSFKWLMGIALTLTLVSLSFTSALNETYRVRKELILKFPLRLKPELDRFNMNFYVRSPRLFKFQLQCVLGNAGFCDHIGRWLAPRVPYILLGQCPKCTQQQEQKTKEVLDFVKKVEPDAYQLLWDRYIITEREESSTTTTISNQNLTESSTVVPPVPYVSVNVTEPPLEDTPQTETPHVLEKADVSTRVLKKVTYMASDVSPHTTEATVRTDQTPDVEVKEEKTVVSKIIREEQFSFDEYE